LKSCPVPRCRRYPQINCDRVRWAIFEPDGGYLTARRACAAVLEGFLAEGGAYRQLAVQRPAPRGSQLSSVVLSDGSQLTADGFVFACGPWL
jgi:glycine/D-amino acid oxidase-like deaminating enzyme